MGNTVPPQCPVGHFHCKRGCKPAGAVKAPTVAAVPGVAAEDVTGKAAVQVEDQYAVFQAKQQAAVPASTGKDGTDVPPLVAQIKKGRATFRFYAPDPDTKRRLESGELDLDEALASGKAYPSITTCLGTLDKPALVIWSAGVAADHGEALLRRLRDAGSEEERNALLDEQLAVADKRTGRSKFRKEAGMAHRQQGDKAADRGTEVHAYAEAISRGENPDIPEELQGYVAGVRKFHEAFPDAEFMYTEATVYNEDGRTMGTTDAIVKIGDKTYVLDYKTNKNASVYSSTGMQLAAAANAKEIVHADGRREPMPKVDGGLGIGVGPDGTMNVFHFDTARDGANHKGFIAARAAWDWKFTSSKDPKPIDPASLF